MMSLFDIVNGNFREKVKAKMQKNVRETPVRVLPSENEIFARMIFVCGIQFSEIICEQFYYLH